MIKLSNLSIGTKLAIIPVVAILMVAAMTAGQLIGNSRSAAAEARAARLRTLAYSAAEAKAATRGMLVGVRDLRLSRNAAEVKAAQEYVAVIRPSAIGRS